MELIVMSALGGLLVNALSGIVGNRADAAVKSAWQAIVDRLKKGGKPINDDLQRAVLRSFILALKTICDDCINELETQKKKAAEDIRWLKQKRRSLDEELKSIEKAEYVEPSLESLEEIELLVLPDGSLAQDRISTVRSKLIETAIGDGEPPRCYKGRVEKELFELMGFFFSDELKGNQRVRNIFEGELLAQIDVRLQGLELTVERIEASLRDSELKKSLALKLGYVVAAINCYLNAMKMGIKTTLDLSAALEIQSKRAYGIAKAIGLSVGPDPNALVRDLPVQLGSTPYDVKTAFRIGNVIGRVYFYSISLMATGSLPPIPPIDQDIDRIREAEQLLGEAGLPSDFLHPVRQLWQDTLEAARRGSNAPIDVQMEDIIGQLCKSIEVGFRYHA